MSEALTDRKPKVGIIGGSGLYKIEGLENIEELEIDTPFGKPSDSFRLGTLSGKEVVFLARHGRNHTHLPSELPHRANIWAMKKLGVRWIISLSAVGSLRENLEPRHFVFPLQFFDRTVTRTEHTFFGGGIVAHVSFADPICETLATVLYQSASTVGIIPHWGGTYVNMEGPAFSTYSESQAHRQLGFDVVGMTNLAEAKLSREAEISYSSVSMVTDFDCWHSAHDAVTVDEVIKTLHDNAESARKLVTHALASIDIDKETPAHTALKSAIITPKDHWPEKTKQKLEPLLTPYL